MPTKYPSGRPCSKTAVPNQGMHTRSLRAFQKDSEKKKVAAVALLMLSTETIDSDYLNYNTQMVPINAPPMPDFVKEMNEQLKFEANTQHMRSKTKEEKEDTKQGENTKIEDSIKQPPGDTDILP